MLPREMMSSSTRTPNTLVMVKLFVFLLAGMALIEDLQPCRIGTMIGVDAADMRPCLERKDPVIGSSGSNLVLCSGHGDGNISMHGHVEVQGELSTKTFKSDATARTVATLLELVDQLNTSLRAALSLVHNVNSSLHEAKETIAAQGVLIATLNQSLQANAPSTLSPPAFWSHTNASACALYPPTGVTTRHMTVHVKVGGGGGGGGQSAGPTPAAPGGNSSLSLLGANGTEQLIFMATGGEAGPSGVSRAHGPLHGTGFSTLHEDDVILLAGAGSAGGLGGMLSDGVSSGDHRVVQLVTTSR